MDIRPDKRQPITQSAIEAAVANHKATWTKWSDRHRSTARWDIEVTLEAEVKHGRDNHRRATETGTEADLLPRERSALHALGALHQATIARSQITDHIKVVRAQKKAATDFTQSVNYRLNWSQHLASSTEALHRMIRRRRRDWHRALYLIDAYKTAAQS